MKSLLGHVSTRQRERKKMPDLTLNTKWVEMKKRCQSHFPPRVSLPNGFPLAQKRCWVVGMPGSAHPSEHASEGCPLATFPPSHPPSRASPSAKQLRLESGIVACLLCAKMVMAGVGGTEKGLRAPPDVHGWGGWPSPTCHLQMGCRNNGTGAAKRWKKDAG